MKRIKKRRNKVFVWALTVCMVLTMLPTTALAADTYDGITVDGGAATTDYIWNGTDKTLTILTGTAMTLSGTATDAQILVAGTTEANLTLNGLSIDNTGENNDDPIKLTGTAKLNLTLASGSENTLDTHYLNTESDPDIYYARADAIHVPLGTALTIGGTGTLTAKSGRYHVAIGSDEGPCGNITVNNGIVNAYAYGTENYPGGVGIGGIVGSDSISGCSSIVINGGTVTAYGDETGIGVDDYYGEVSYSITITGGIVNAYGIPYSDDVDPEDTSSTYLRSVGIGGHAFGSPNTRNIEISGGTVTAYGSEAAIGGNSADDNEGDSANPLNIRITGGTVTAKGFDYTNPISIGGNIRSTDQRSIEISGTARVDAAGYYDTGAIGGGDNSGSTIRIKGDAVVVGASAIGSTGYDSGTSSGYAGGTIQILEDASVGGDGYYEAIGRIGGSDADIYNGIGGSGGNITINTTGTVNATVIGGGSGADGGDGGNIIIQNGNVYSTHIGGGDGKNSDGTGVGGDGGNITISGGQIGEGGTYPTASTNKHSGSGASTHYYAAAGIGGGGGTSVGGNGGTIDISGGMVYANAGLTVYDLATGSTATSGTGVGGAGIGGGNGASGGAINISGGNVEVSNVYVSPNEATTATAAPALIGGGSAGGAGQITISGGYVRPHIYSENCGIYGNDATVIGQGKGATDAGGWIKVIGGTLDVPLSTYQTSVARPVPWPVAADGSTLLYPTTFDFYFAENRPEELNITGDDEIVSLIITEKSGGETYSYGKTGIKPNSYFWLPIEEDTSAWTNSDTHELYDITVSVKKDNTVYGYTGLIRYYKNENYVGEIAGNCSLTYTGEVTETLKLTSSGWGIGNKSYDGTDHTPTFTVKNSANVELVKGVDYELEIRYTPNDGTGTPVTVTEMKNAGGYIATATGKAGTDYAGMTATSDQFWINPKHITGIYSGSAFTKQYDGRTDVYSGATEVESIELTVNPDDIVPGDSLTNIVAQNPRYASFGVGSGIEINANSAAYTYTQNMVSCSIFNYSVDLPAITGDITVKVVGETNLDASGVTVTKVYNGNTICTLANVSGGVALVDLVGDEIATVNITGVSNFDSADVGTAHSVTLTVGSLAGSNAANYALAGGATTVEVDDASITPADYSYNLTEAQQAQQFAQGGGLSQISRPAAANGVNGETVSGTVTLWHDAGCTANQATDASVNALTVGNHNLYVKFVPDASQTNYNTTKITTGRVVVLTVVEGDPQELSFTTIGPVSKTYGDNAFINSCTNSSSGGGIIAYFSNNTSVAEVNAVSGEVTIKGAGTATITATAAEVEGKYRETAIDYTLNVSKKAITVTAEGNTRKYGTANPGFTFTHNPLDLVSGDDANDLAVTLSCAATAESPAGTPVAITGVSASANYNVTVTSGVLTITKADAPVVNGITKNLLYSAAHADVVVNITGLPVNCGTISFAAGSVTGDDSIIDGVVADTANGIQFSTNIGTENQTASIPVTVTMQNYEDITVTVLVKLVAKTPVTITGVTVENKTYNGTVAAYVGTPANEQSYTGTYEYLWSGGSAPKDAGNYTLTVKVPEGNAEFMGEVEIPFTIAQKALTVKPQNLSIYNGAALPTAFTLVYEGLVSGDSITPTGTPAAFALKNGADALADSSVNGTYAIAWTNKAEVTVEHSNYSITKADGTLTISAQPSKGGGSAAPATPVTPATPAPGGSGATVTTTVEAKTNSNGTVTASVAHSQVTSAIEKAQAAAKSSGEAPSVEIQVSGGADARAVESTLPKDSVQALATGKMESLTLSSPVANMSFDTQALSAIADAASGDVSFAASKVDGASLSEEAAKVVGDRPVYQFSVTSGGDTISEFGGAVTVSVPYTPAAEEDTNAIVVYYINAKGEPELMQGCRYDAATKTLVFTTTHFSQYAVGYHKVTFADVSGTAWYGNAVTFLASRGITGGTSADKFSPDATLTRGQFVVLLLRAYGIAAEENPKANFLDAGNTYYTGYLAAARNLGLSNGIGGNKFAPEKAITRQEMFTLLYNALKTMDRLPDSDSGKALSDFTDSANISSYAQEGMSYLVETGIVGGDKGQLSPTATLTRAQMAQVLYNLLSK